MGWTNIPWYSSHKSDFNYDFHVTLDPAIANAREYNYKPASATEKGERGGMSFFWKGDQKRGGDVDRGSVDGGGEEEIFHTYSTYSRGTEFILGTNRLLDLTPLGRQDVDEKGNSTFWRLHDEY